MLDQIIDLVKNQATSHFVNETEVPNEQAENTAAAAGQSIFEQLQEQIQGGNLEAVKNLLSGQEDGQSGELMQKMKAGFQDKIQNMGINPETANGAAENSFPQILQNVIGKFKSQDQADAGFDIQGLMSGVLGDGAQDKLSGLFGGKIGGIVGNLFGKK